MRYVNLLPVITTVSFSTIASVTVDRKFGSVTTDNKYDQQLGGNLFQKLLRLDKQVSGKHPTAQHQLTFLWP